ncbi:MAG: FAD binding domain-containing protein [Nitrospinota bacterium]
MELPEIKHVDAKDPREAVSLLCEYGDRAKVIAGATDLLGIMKDGLEGPELKTPEILVNIKTIPEMARIEYEEDGSLRIGAAVTLDRIETSQIISQKFGILSQAASVVGTLQLRNMGTIGGNICQRPRCMYFRHPHFICRKKGGEKCYAITGEHRDYYSIFLKKRKCVMAHPSDMGPALVALNANVVIAGSEGKREMALQDFFIGPDQVTETSLRPDELLVEFLVPNQGVKTYQCFSKRRIRRSFDFALASVAAVARIDEEVCREIRIVLGGVAHYPIVATGAEQVLKGKKLSDELISTAADVSVEKAQPLPMNGYKRDLTRVSVKRALHTLRQESSST